MYSSLLFLKVIEYQKITPSGITPNGKNRIPFYQKTINWAKIGDLFSDPGGMVKSNYTWGSGLSTDYDSLFRVLERALFNFGLEPKRSLVENEYFTQYYAGNGLTNPIESFEIKLLEEFDPTSNNYAKISFTLLPNFDSVNNTLTGIKIIPKIIGKSSLNIPLSPSLLLRGDGYFASDNFLNFTLAPDELG